MDKIMDLLNNISLEKYIPKLDSVMDLTQKAIELAVQIGPFCILVLGLIYLLIPPREANRYFGFRTYFGMGSVIAWNVTQRIAGAIMIPTGLILTIIAYVKVAKFPGYDMMTMVNVAFQAVKGQAICALIIYIFMFLLTAVLFDRKGDCRFGDEVNDLLHKLVPNKVLSEVYVKVPASSVCEEELEEEPFEEPENEKITADDIVIEDLE